MPMTLVAFLLSSCVTSKKLTTVSFDPRVLTPCLGPVAVPDREITKGELVTFYNTNRDRLVVCKKKHQELTRQIERLEREVGVNDG